ncbi:MAG: ribonuclease P protein component [Actinobacteria bacterium]|nr:ribonuclease P protein component [Actinomycetota bacterium]MBO0788099.1 ribonuclease P protein component [Actinomycetota bacterium]MDR0343174.1 ribonuclease P protein component [Nocardiopsaceae bacterium]
MLPGPARMRRREDFTAAVRGGSRASQRLLTGHLLVRDCDEPARAGFIVSKAVGGAVVRNRVRRRLRSAVAGCLRSLPGGSLLVVRAHPQAATARQADMAAELSLVITTLLRRQVGTARR